LEPKERQTEVEVEAPTDDPHRDGQARPARLEA